MLNAGLDRLIDALLPDTRLVLALSDGLIGYLSEGRDAERYWSIEAIMVATLLHSDLSQRVLGWNAAGWLVWEQDDSLVVESPDGSTRAFVLSQCTALANNSLDDTVIADKLGCAYAETLFEAGDIAFVFTSAATCCVRAGGRTLILDTSTPLAPSFRDTSELLAAIVMVEEQ